MAQASTKGPAPKGTQKGDQPTKALSDAPVQVMTLSEAWRECSQQIKLAVRSEQKARLDYLKNTEYGKEFMMRMTEVATVVVDQGSAGMYAHLCYVRQMMQHRVTNSLLYTHDAQWSTRSCLQQTR